MRKISLIITTFSRPEMLKRAVRSAFEAGQDVEVIVVDDASTDETSDVCRTFPEVKYIRAERNQGVAGARNLGLLESTGTYIAFLDDDDVRLPGSLDHQLAILEPVPEAGFVASAVLIGDQDCVPTGEIVIPGSKGGDVFWQAIEMGLSLLPASILVRKSCFFEVGLFGKQIKGIDDWDMWTRIAEVRPIVVDDRPVSIYRSPTPFSDQGSSALAQQLTAAVRQQEQLLALPRAKQAAVRDRSSARWNLKRRISDTLSRHAAEQLPRGAFRFAVKNFFTALRFHPLWAARPAHFRVLWKSALNQVRQD